MGHRQRESTLSHVPRSAGSRFRFAFAVRPDSSANVMPATWACWYVHAGQQRCDPLMTRQRFETRIGLSWSVPQKSLSPPQLGINERHVGHSFASRIWRIPTATLPS